MANTIKFAVAGVGHIGKRHAEMIRRQPGAELVAMCDIRTPDACGISIPGIPFYPSLEKLLDETPDADVVNICTPNGLHSAMTLLCLSRGKHVVVEKPMALNKQDAELMIHESLKSGKQIFCVMQNRYSPPALWLKSLMDENRLGQIFHVQINCFWNRDERYYTGANWHGTADLDGGTLFTQFSHFIDIMYWLFGDITNLYARFHDHNHQFLTDFEDSGTVLFDFLKGGSGTLNYSTALFRENLESSITIIGEQGTVKVSGQYMNEVAYCNIRDYEMPVLETSAPPNDYGAYKGSAQNHHLVIRNVVETLRGMEPANTNALEGLKVVDIIERIYQQRTQQWKKQ